MEKKHKIGIVIPHCSKERNPLLYFVMQRMEEQTMPIDYVCLVDFAKGKDVIQDIPVRYKKGIKECFDKKCDLVFLIEDDDYYPITYIAQMYEQWVKKDYPVILGLNVTTYYHIMNGSYQVIPTPKHSSAFCTAISRKADYLSPADYDKFYDVQLWRRNKGALVSIENMPVGIKHGIGECGGAGHTKTLPNLDDGDYTYLQKIVDEKGFAFYMSFIQPPEMTEEEWANVNKKIGIKEEPKQPFNPKRQSIEFLQIDGYQVQQHKEELEFMVNKSKGKTNYMEIGIYNGGTFNYMSKFIKGRHIAVDIDNWKERNDNLTKSVKGCEIIIGNTHEDITLNKVRETLNGDLVDVLFIDGDHTEEGVRLDFEMYKQFVSDGGYIFFHDIIDSEFHSKHNCFVDRFWKNAPEPKESISVSDHWGGIGCIINRKVDWKCYQIYFDKESKKGLLPCFTPYNNKDKSHLFFENRVIKEIAEQIDNETSDYIGVCSWRFSEKTNMTEERFKQVVGATNCNQDVLFFSHKELENCNPIQREKELYPYLYKLSKMIDDENILPFKIEHDKWSCSYANYWLAKKSIYKEYVDKILTPMMEAFETNEKIKDYVEKHPFMHRGITYPLIPFILELLMGFYVNKYKISHKFITPKTKIRLDNSNKFKIHG